MHFPEEHPRWIMTAHKCWVHHRQAQDPRSLQPHRVLNAVDFPAGYPTLACLLLCRSRNDGTSPFPGLCMNRSPTFPQGMFACPYLRKETCMHPLTSAPACTAAHASTEEGPTLTSNFVFARVCACTEHSCTPITASAVYRPVMVHLDAGCSVNLG